MVVCIHLKIMCDNFEWYDESDGLQRNKKTYSYW